MVGLLLRLTRSLVIGSVVMFVVGQLAKLLLPSEGSAESPRFRRVAIMGGDSFSSSADPLDGGDVNVIMGAGFVDLTDAVPAPGARVGVFVKAGATRIEVPADWQVDVDAVSILGDVTVEPPPEPVGTDAPRLAIEGQVLFGGLMVARR